MYAEIYARIELQATKSQIRCGSERQDTTDDNWATFKQYLVVGYRLIEPNALLSLSTSPTIAQS